MPAPRPPHLPLISIPTSSRPPADEWRKNKRYIEYAQVKPLSDYNYQTIPGPSRSPSRPPPAPPSPHELTRSRSCPLAVQWSSWLRRTRREPPSLEELETDLRRQLRLRDNVARLEAAYADEKLRLGAAQEGARLAAPQGATRGGAEGAAARGTATVAGHEVDGLPLEDGGVDAPAGQRTAQIARGLDGVQHAAPAPAGAAARAKGLPLRDGGADAEAGKRAPVVARELREGAERVEPSAGVAAQEGELSAEALAKRRRDEDHAAALRRREEFGAFLSHSLLLLLSRAVSRLTHLSRSQPSRTRRRSRATRATRASRRGGLRLRRLGGGSASLARAAT